MKKFLLTLLAAATGFYIGTMVTIAECREMLPPTEFCLELSETYEEPEVYKQPQIIKTVDTELLTEIEEPPESLGVFTVTAYCPCECCCGKTDGITATGVPAVAGQTIAVDPSVIPYGSTVIIDGHEYIAQDCGGAIKGNRIDIYFDSHSEALDFGVGEYEIFLR